MGLAPYPNNDITQKNHTFRLKQVHHPNNTIQFLQEIFHSQDTKEILVKNEKKKKK